MRALGQLMRECVLRPKSEDGKSTGGTDLPVTILIGPRGSGKTQLLDDIGDACKRSASLPFVRLDMENTRAEYLRSWQITTHLAADLGAIPWKQFGTIRFPRLTLGALVVQSDGIDLSDQKQARADVTELLRGQRDLSEATELLTGLLRQLLISCVPQLPWLAALAPWLAKSAFASRRAVKLLFGTGLRWYGNRDYGVDGFGTLTDLNRLEHRADSPGRHAVDTLLLEAFLADLSAAYGKSRPCNTTVLVDNIDAHEVGGLFLAALATARENAASAADAESDPLAVFCTSRSWLDTLWAWAPPWEPSPGLQGPRVGTVHSASLAHWRTQHRDQGLERWFYPLALGDLTVQEVRRSAAALPNERQRLAPFVHRLTNGHPGGTRRLLDTLGALGSTTPSDAELIRVLDRGVAGHTTLAAMALAEQLDGELLIRQQALEVWAAAQDLHTAIDSQIEMMPDTTQNALREALQEQLWLVPAPSTSPEFTDEDTDDGGPMLHPWLRRLLLHSLAARSDSQPLHWNDVHERLRGYHLGLGQEGRAAYHALAQGEARPAAEHLNHAFESLSSRSWIARFDSIASAPNRLGHADTADDSCDAPQTAESHLDRLRTQFASPAGRPSDGTREDRLPPGDPYGTRHDLLVNMVLTHWLWSDPLRDPGSTLSSQLASGFDVLSQQLRRGSAPLNREAQRYRHFGSG